MRPVPHWARHHTPVDGFYLVWFREFVIPAAESWVLRGTMPGLTQLSYRVDIASQDERSFVFPMLSSPAMPGTRPRVIAAARKIIARTSQLI